MNGFHLGLQEKVDNLPQTTRNPNCTIQEKCAILEDFIKELKLGRIECTHESPKCVSPISVIPKDEDKFRLIRNLSYPKGSSLNDNILPDAKKVKYPSHRELAYRICKEGKGAYIARQDLKAAYRQVKMHTSASHYLGYRLYGRWLRDNYVVFGLSSACRIFQYVTIASIIVFEYLYLQIKHRELCGKITSYLDDYITIVAGWKNAIFLYYELEKCLEWLGFILNKDKCLLPSQQQIVLGLFYDTIAMTVSLPLEKVKKYSKLIISILNKGFLTGKELSSLTGKLQFAASVIPPGKAFLTELRRFGRQCVDENETLTLDDNVRADLRWWLHALELINGIPLVIPAGLILKTTNVFTDACLTGIGGTFKNQCFQYQLPTWNQLRDANIAVIEIYAVAVATATWGNQWTQQRVIFKIDSKHAGAALKKMNDRDREIMTFVRFIGMESVKHKFTYQVDWIPSKENVFADSLSRCDFSRFLNECSLHNCCFDFTHPCFPNLWFWN